MQFGKVLEMEEVVVPGFLNLGSMILYTMMELSGAVTMC